MLTVQDPVLQTSALPATTGAVVVFAALCRRRKLDGPVLFLCPGMESCQLTVGVCLSFDVVRRGTLLLKHRLKVAVLWSGGGCCLELPRSHGSRKAVV